MKDIIKLFAPIRASDSFSEQGTHEQLVQKEGTYYKMIELQSGF